MLPPEEVAKQKPAWTPGEHHGYHGITLGFYENELVRRIDAEEAKGMGLVNRVVGQGEAQGGCAPAQPLRRRHAVQGEEALVHAVDLHG